MANNPESLSNLWSLKDVRITGGFKEAFESFILEVDSNETNFLNYRKLANNSRA